MFKDDRMMSMFTFVVIMIALGTVVQRSDVVGRLFGEGPIPLELRSDEVILLANELTGIDVLANDAGLRSSDAERLVVVAQPDCGRVFVRDGKAFYLPAERCAGAQTFRYGIAGRDGHTGDVTAVVRLKDPTQNQVTADAQRDISTPTPGATRPAMTRNATDPSVLTPQSAAPSEQAASVPNVPRPQAGQAAPLALPPGGGTQTANPGVVVEGAGQTPSIVVPDRGLGAGPAIRSTDAPRAPTPQPLDSGSATAAGPAVEPQVSGSAAAGDQPRQIGGLDLQLQGQSSAPRTGTSYSAPAAMGGGDSTATPADQPAAALGTLLEREGQAGSSPPIIPQPPVLSDPGKSDGMTAASEQQPLGEVAAPAPQTLTNPDGTGAVQQAPETAAAPPAPPAEPCTVPPALTIRTLPGASTEVAVDAPCDAGRVALLSYDTLEFGLPIGADGKGSIIVPGLQRFSTAELRLPGGDGLAFDLPFIDIERLDRMVIVWELPVELDLHAFEFGALRGSDGHVRPDNPRSFEEVRRRGGGYLLSYRPVSGNGQNISVYTYWRRPGGETGIVKLALDFASRSAGAMAGTCGSGALARPDYRLLHSEGGTVSPPGLRRLAPLDCAAVAGAERLIGDAVDDLVVLKR